ncbi:MAG: beta-phosphoglucomutase family hydrolase [Bacteroidota bacterium]|nr:beta-phosphoglucomutase family hydrolase [Bacteroidota bacterium]
MSKKKKQNSNIQVPEGIEGLIFDLDGTLADNMPLHFQAWSNACSSYDLPCVLEEMLKYAGLSTYKIALEVFKKYKGNHNPKLAKELAEKKISEYDKLHDLTKPFPEVVNIVYKYYNKLPMAVGTGGIRAAAKKTLELLDLTKYFVAVVAAEDVENHKPEPDTFLKCAEFMKVDPANCLVFEDGDRGVEAAKRAGMQVVDIREYIE